ncbi:MAG: hypothetical protein K6F93_08715 [Lachnospiraceae bacterium]|nr:hypothetical protein [Lachnospiraceae bacterium]
MGERNRFAFDRDYYNRIAAKYVNGSSAKDYALNDDNEDDLEKYLTATYAPEYMETYSGTSVRRETARTYAQPARKISEELPERTAPRENTSGETKHVTKIKTRYLIRFKLFRTACVAALIVLVVQVSLNLLSLKSDVNLIDKELSDAKITLEDVNSYNESLLGQLDISYDRNYIYNVAVGKLGMVYPKDNAVVYYKAADTSHVIQYRDIP